jgi:molecular chaperone DnaK
MQVKALTESRNHGDALVHATRKSLAEYGDKLEAGEKTDIETAIKELEEALKGNDKSAIDEKITALSNSAQKLGEKMYANSQSQETGGAGDAATGDAHQRKDDDVVDADFKEVKK